MPRVQGLYGVVVALALSLSLAVSRLIPPSGRDVIHRPLLLALALLVTVIPFYHGALRTSMLRLDEPG